MKHNRNEGNYNRTHTELQDPCCRLCVDWDTVNHAPGGEVLPVLMNRLQGTRGVGDGERGLLLSTSLGQVKDCPLQKAAGCFSLGHSHAERFCCLSELGGFLWFYANVKQKFSAQYTTSVLSTKK